jgi:hypothetical protein
MRCGDGWGGEGRCEEGGYGEEMGGVQWRGVLHSTQATEDSPLIQGVDSLKHSV